MKKFFVTLAFVGFSTVPSMGHAAAAEYCDYIIPYQTGAGTNVQLQCYKMTSDWKRGLCIQSCKRKCDEHQRMCDWELNDLTQCYLGCENGPQISGVKEMQGAADIYADALGQE